MKILVVEPDSSTRQTLTLVLRALGHDVFRPESVDETIPFLNGYWPDAIVLNYFLGDKTGPQFCSEILELFGELPSTLIHSPVPEHRFFALRYPETSFLKSPFSPDELQSALSTLVPVEIFLTG